MTVLTFQLILAVLIFLLGVTMTVAGGKAARLSHRLKNEVPVADSDDALIVLPEEEPTSTLLRSGPVYKKGKVRTKRVASDDAIRSVS